MIGKIKDLIKRHPLHRKIFAIRQGTRKGEFFVYISESDEDYNFLILPEIDTVTVKKPEFDHGLNKKIVEVVEKLPDNIYQICCAQYNESKSKNDINRLKQSLTPSGLDSGKRKKKR